MSRPEQSNTLAMAALPHTYARGTPIHPRAGHRHPEIGPNAVLPTYLHRQHRGLSEPASHLGGHHHTRVAGSLLTAAPEKPRCCARPTLPTPVPRVSPSPRQCKGLMELTPATGARGNRTSACGSVGLVSARPGHCPAGRAPRTAPAPRVPLTSRPLQGSARRRRRHDRHLHPGLPKAPIH